jgi:hypothetical protein
MSLRLNIHRQLFPNLNPEISNINGKKQKMVCHGEAMNHNEFTLGIISKKDLSSSEKIVLLYLHAEISKSGQKIITLPMWHIADNLSMSDRRMREIIGDLEYKDYLYVERRTTAGGWSIPSSYQLSEKCYCKT